jgi:PEP-CTERM motif
MRQWTLGFAATIATIAAAATANAASVPFDPNTLFANFNVITDGNFATKSDVHGPVLIGGNLSGNGILDFAHIPQSCCTTPVPNYGVINVFGNNTGSWSQIPSQTVFIGGSNTGHFTGQPTVTTGYTFPGFNSPGAGSNAATFANDIWAPLTSMSTNLAGLASTSTFSGGVLNGVKGPNGAVFDIPLSTLNAFTGTLHLGGCLAGPTPCDAVINVTGTGTFVQAFKFPVTADIPGLENVLFNFESATGVEWGNPGNFDASILAPDAVGSNNGSAPLVGTLVIDSVSATAPLGNEIHNSAFDCSDNLCTCPPGAPGCGSGPPADIPEPGSLALLGSGIAAFVTIRRRRAGG